MFAHVAGISVEEALLAGVTVLAGYVRATAARPVERRWLSRRARSSGR